MGDRVSREGGEGEEVSEAQRRRLQGEVKGGRGGGVDREREGLNQNCVVLFIYFKIRFKV